MSKKLTVARTAHSILHIEKSPRKFGLLGDFHFHISDCFTRIRHLSHHFSSLRHKLRELVRKVYGILGQDAFDDQRLRVEDVAVVLEVLRFLARFV